MYLSEAKASRSHKMWTEVSSSVPHFLHMGSAIPPSMSENRSKLFGNNLTLHWQRWLFVMSHAYLFVMSHAYQFVMSHAYLNLCLRSLRPSEDVEYFLPNSTWWTDRRQNEGAVPQMASYVKPTILSVPRVVHSYLPFCRTKPFLRNVTAIGSWNVILEKTFGTSCHCWDLGDVLLYTIS